MTAWLFSKKKEGEKKAGSGDFVSLASHELRSPLSIIKWYTEMLLDEDAGPLTEEQRKYLTTIETSNQRAIDLVRSLLNVSRLESESFIVAPESTSFGELLEGCITSQKENLSKKQIIFSQEIVSTLPTVLIDKRLTSLVLKELLTNAITYSREGGNITIKASLVGSGEYYGEILPYESIVVELSDQGIGIPETDQPKVFSKMFRASNVKDGDGNGSGLGLYIAKTIMEYVQGKLWFTSSPEGSTFCAAFPTKGMEKKEGKTTLD